MEKKKTYFVDIDGTIFVYRKFEDYTNVPAVAIKSTKQYLQKVRDEGHMIILTTARPDYLRTHTIYELGKNKIDLASNKECFFSEFLKVTPIILVFFLENLGRSFIIFVKHFK